MDIMELPATSRGNQYLLVFTDYLTKWVEAVAIKNRTSVIVADAFFSHIVCRHGVPFTVLSDQGKEFCESVMKKLLELLGVKKLTTSSHHPQCNGLTERFNRTFTGMLRTYASSEAPAEWDLRLPALLFAYRTHYHRVAKKSPFYLLYGRNPSTPASLIVGNLEQQYTSRDDWLRENVATMPKTWEFVSKQMKVEADKIQRRTNKLLSENKLKIFELGDKVYAYIYTAATQRVEYKVKPAWKGPFSISKVISLTTYEIEHCRTKERFVVWAGYLKPAVDQDIPDNPTPPDFKDASSD
jgi:hypothetical protein